MISPIKQIVKFNQDAGLLENGYDDFLESSMLIEEALEPFVNGTALFSAEFHDNYTAKELSRTLIDEVFSFTGPSRPEATDVDRLDKACDAVIIAVGSMAKLGLDAQQITKALNVVMNANNAKLHMPKDSAGKLMKPEGFVGPEPELQKILDERKN